ncbi:DUF1217 domain-containing protein [Algicella marina]|uniref:DUF1217 domain-containing protein n=1 Tax=Algicella marina TaxID=2683284 RepID=A0A6P1T418_9RHOB|nr:DUF1217 domain-containing protein [Algicella marina]QHQ36443.1 DUF1217 domain-containing protein [Algicella marina]
MIFQPATPLSGVAGLRFLERTQATQQETFDKSPVIARNVANFHEKIGSILTAEELVADRQLLSVALGAFGLDDEIDKKFFIRKILEEGTENNDALAMRFTDPRYRRFSAAFGFGSSLGPRTGEPDFAQRITDAYKTRQFEIAVGNNDTNLRLAMGFKREISEIVASEASDETKWFQILGSEPIRAVFDGGFGLPTQFKLIDIDKQVETLQERTGKLFGSSSPSVFANSENVDALLNRFLARAEAESGPSGNTPGFAALSLLQNASSFGASARINLILSNG